MNNTEYYEYRKCLKLYISTLLHLRIYPFSFLSKTICKHHKLSPTRLYRVAYGDRGHINFIIREMYFDLSSNLFLHQSHLVDKASSLTIMLVKCYKLLYLKQQTLFLGHTPFYSVIVYQMSAIRAESLLQCNGDSITEIHDSQYTDSYSFFYSRVPHSQMVIAVGL